MCTYLSEGKLLEERFGVVGFAKHEVWGNFHVASSILCGDERLVCTEVLGIGVQGLKNNRKEMVFEKWAYYMKSISFRIARMTMETIR